MLTISELKSKLVVMIDAAPFQVLEVKHLHMGRGGSSVQTRIKNLLTGQVFSRNFKPSDAFEEADIEKRDLNFLYAHPVRSAASDGAGRKEYVFSAKENPRERFMLSQEKIGESAKWLKPATTVGAIFLDGQLLNITPPIKAELKVIEAPPGFKGDTATGGTKTVVVETGAKVQTPLFINEGDIIRINTETGEYAERVEKG
ncbi:MAG: elongation factor P [Candidatus Sungbacteria bacterium]|nr:elongation factor P [Candidatus Sungbacteria bacterium]